MIKSLSISYLLKLAAIIFLTIFTLILINFFIKNSTKADNFNLYTNNLGIGTSEPNVLAVVVTNPTSGSSVSGTVNITAEASSSATVTQVEFYVDSNLLGTSTSVPYSKLWDTTIYPHNSVHTIIANALDSSGNQATSSAVTVTVLDITAPAVSITSPINGSTVTKNSTVTITANASDVSGIDRVEFYVNNVLICTDTLSSYSCIWKVPPRKNGVYTLQAKGYDTAGNSLTSTVTVTSK